MKFLDWLRSILKKDPLRTVKWLEKELKKQGEKIEKDRKKRAMRKIGSIK